MSVCSSCGAEIGWVKTSPDRRMPIDLATVEIGAVGLVAVNPGTGGGRVLRNEDLGDVARWRRWGVTLHRSHFATCPTAERHRVSSEQLALGELEEDGPDDHSVRSGDRGGGELAASGVTPGVRRGQPDRAASA